MSLGVVGVQLDWGHWGATTTWAEAWGVRTNVVRAEELAA